MRFQGIFTVPNAVTDACQGWTFSWSLCCRNTSNTLVGQPNMYVESYVNHVSWVQPRNNSSRFNIGKVLACCATERNTIVLNRTENQGDSSTFALVPAMVGANQIAPYQINRSPQTPIAIANGSTIHLDQRGNLNVLANQIQDGVFVVRVFELRLRQNGLLDTVGWTTLDMMVNFVLGCGSCCDSPPSFVSRSQTRSCDDSTLIINFSKSLFCNTIDRGGSKLRLFDSLTNTTLPIISATPLACSSTVLGDVTNRIEINLGQRLYKNGRYFLITRTGIDGDTYLGTCGNYVKPFDTMRINVGNCYQYDDPIDLVNVSVDSVTNNAVLVQWAIPQNFDFSYFRRYRLFREADTLIHSAMPFALLTDTLALSFWDSMPIVSPSMATSRYAIDWELNNTIKNQLSTGINTIKLFEPMPPSGLTNPVITVVWNHYSGWINPMYVLQFGSIINGILTWTDVATTTANVANLQKPATPGTQYVRVYARNNINNLVSYSNWIDFIVPVNFISIPNVFTPNGDGVNDYFEIEHLSHYPNTKLEVFDRMGRNVFKSNNYKNDWGGAVKEGLYYFVLTHDNGQIRKGEIMVITK